MLWPGNFLSNLRPNFQIAKKLTELQPAFSKKGAPGSFDPGALYSSVRPAGRLNVGAGAPPPGAGTPPG